MKTVLFGTYPQSEVSEELRKKLNSLLRETEKHPFEFDTSNRLFEYDHDECWGKIKKQFKIANNSKRYSYNQQIFRRVLVPKKADRWFAYEPISWAVLAEDEHSMLLVSEKVLDKSCFNPNVYVNYEIDDGHYWYVLQSDREANVFYGSYMDLWLNYSFLHDAFTKDERNQIVEYGLPHRYHEYVGGKYDNYDLQDRVMYERKIQLPSEELLKRSRTDDRIMTAFSKAQKGTSEYWYMDSWDYYGSTPCRAGISVLTNKGMRDVTETCGVVPVITVKK